MSSLRRPPGSYAPGLQHERTALAWERTAIAMMVAGVVLARVGAEHRQWVVAGVGLAQTVAGGALLVWAGIHYDDLHGPLRRGDDVIHPLATRLVGVITVAACGLGLGFAMAVALLG